MQKKPFTDQWHDIRYMIVGYDKNNKRVFVSRDPAGKLCVISNPYNALKIIGRKTAEDVFRMITSKIYNFELHEVVSSFRGCPRSLMIYSSNEDVIKDLIEVSKEETLF